MNTQNKAVVALLLLSCAEVATAVNVGNAPALSGFKCPAATAYADKIRCKDCGDLCFNEEAWEDYKNTKLHAKKSIKRGLKKVFDCECPCQDHSSEEYDSCSDSEDFDKCDISDIYGKDLCNDSDD